MAPGVFLKIWGKSNEKQMCQTKFVKNELYMECFHGNGLKIWILPLFLKIITPKKKFGARGWHQESFLKIWAQSGQKSKIKHSLGKKFPNALYPGQKKKNHPRDLGQEEHCSILWYHAWSRAISAGQLSRLNFALHWLRMIEHASITRGTVFF